MREERLERRRKEKAEQVAYKLEREIAMWDPTQLKSATEDPFKTLFVARVVSTYSRPHHAYDSSLIASTLFFVQNYDTSESKLRREFEVYGPIKKIFVVQNIDTSKPRGYAFIEYEHERDMHCKYFMCCSVEWQPDIHHTSLPPHHSLTANGSHTQKKKKQRKRKRKKKCVLKANTNKFIHLIRFVCEELKKFVFETKRTK